MVRSIRIFAGEDRLFSGRGLGILTDVSSCLITEERNGIFDLDMMYHAGGANWGLINPGRILFCKARPGDTIGEPFRIYATERSGDGRITVRAHHISYDFNAAVFTGQANTTVSGIRAAVTALNNRRVGADMVRVWFDGFAEDDGTVFDIGTIKLLSEALGGEEGSLLATFGGELKYEYDATRQIEIVTLCAQRGKLNAGTVGYGVNLTAFELSRDNSSRANYAIAYITKTENNITTYQRHTIQLIDPAETGEAPRYMLVDVSSECEWGATEEQMTEAVYKLVGDEYWGERSVSVSFVPAKEYGIDETELECCDRIRLLAKPLGINAPETLTVTKTVYNWVTDHYESVTAGTIRRKVTDTVARLGKEIRYVR